MSTQTFAQFCYNCKTDRNFYQNVYFYNGIRKYKYELYHKFKTYERMMKSLLIKVVEEKIVFL